VDPPAGGQAAQRFHLGGPVAFYSRQQELSRYKGRYVVMLFLITVVFIVFAGRLYCLQVSHGDEYRSLSLSNFVSVRRDVPLRGMIFDRAGTLLVDNRPSFNVYFTPAFCKQEAFESTLTRLTEYLGLSEVEKEQTEHTYKTTERLDRFLPVLVRRDISWSELAAVEQNLDLLEGVEVRPETRRAYPHGTTAAHLLGYVGEISPKELETRKVVNYRQGDMIGKKGVEGAWELELRGTPGVQQVVVDARGQRVPDSVAHEVLKGLPKQERAVPGNNLVLSLDARLQAVAEKRFPGIEGAAVAVDPKTGFILAILSRPSFDPNQLSGRLSPRWWNELILDPDKPLTNRATQQHYPPGSTFKPFTGLAALDKEALTEDDKELCRGAMRYGSALFRCWRRGGHGKVAMHRAVVQSCDVYFYRAGLKAGLDAIADMSKSFGFGSITGFKSAREVPGIMPNKLWYQKHTKTGFLPGFTVSDSSGQGDVNVTPLQLAMAYAAIGNGGTLYAPQIVKRIESPTGEVIKTFEPLVRGKAKAKPEHLKIMQDALQGVCNEPGGTGYYRRPRKVEFKVAGKTGTAQVVKQGDDRGKDLPYDFRDHAWFAAYAPADDPRIAVAVVNEHGGHGSSGAAPLAMELITYYLVQIEAEDLRAEAGEE
jgi:penicillin-binding protein 2